MFFCYILYSSSLDAFYVGTTHVKPEDRLAKDNQSFYPGQHFTSRASDWELYLIISCHFRVQATGIEKHIKRMKSKVYIQNLKRYPEMVEKLLFTYGEK